MSNEKEKRVGWSFQPKRNKKPEEGRTKVVETKESGWLERCKGGLSERKGEVREGKEKEKARVEKGVKKTVAEGVSRTPSPFCGV